MKTDFLVIGSGAAGLSFALKAAAHGHVTIVTKGEMNECNTNYAQGGICSVTYAPDTFEKHIRDTLVCGAGKCDEEAVGLVVRRAPELIRDLIEWGTRFDKTPDGRFELNREGGHTEHRILHHEDLTGAEIERALVQSVREHPNITVLERHFAIDLLTQHHLGEFVTRHTRGLTCFGAYVLNLETNEIETMLAKFTVVATGGCGNIYSTTSNPVVATGDGIAMCHRAKAITENMEFIQFHPTTLYNPGKDKTEKCGGIYILRGKKQVVKESLHAGDIGAMAKLQYTSTGDTLCDPANPVIYPPIEYPKPCISKAVYAAKQGEEDKVFSGLQRLMEEDPSVTLSKDPETMETLLSGQGEMHLDVIRSKLASKFGANCVLKDPKIPYRETIRKTVKVQGRHKKQTGGHGQFGDVWIEFSPVTDGSTDIVFEDAVVGGVVPRNFIPSVEKGLRECMVHGVLAGYPMVSVKAKLYDGSYHPVDSSEMAFKTAARIAYKKGCADANPVLLEPIMHVEVIVPDDYMGDVMGDMNKRRGRIIGMEQCEGGQKIIAEAPLSEMFKYATDLRSMTQAWGRFTMTFERYEEVPADVAKKVIASADKVVDDDE